MALCQSLPSSPKNQTVMMRIICSRGISSQAMPTVREREGATFSFSLFPCPWVPLLYRTSSHLHLLLLLFFGFVCSRREGNNTGEHHLEHKKLQPLISPCANPNPGAGSAPTLKPGSSGPKQKARESTGAFSYLVERVMMIAVVRVVLRRVVVSGLTSTELSGLTQRDLSNRCTLDS